MEMTYPMDFTVTDELYEGDKAGYADFLQISIEEFEIDTPKFRQALEEKDPELFSAMKHKFSTRLDVFQLTSLSEFLQNISNSYKAGVDSFDEKMAAIELDRHFRGIVSTLREKLALVKG